MIHVIPQALDLEAQELVKSTLLGKQNPWWYVSDITKDSELGNPGMVNYLVRDGKEIHALHDVLCPYILKNFESIGMDVNDASQARSFLQFPIAREKILDTPHVDQPGPHWVWLYYVLDSDGDTVIYLPDGKEQTVTPKQGTAVLFDGKLKHTAYQPQKNLRLIVNYNVI